MSLFLVGAAWAAERVVVVGLEEGLGAVDEGWDRAEALGVAVRSARGLEAEAVSSFRSPDAARIAGDLAELGGSLGEGDMVWVAWVGRGAHDGLGWRLSATDVELRLGELTSLLGQGGAGVLVLGDLESDTHGPPAPLAAPGPSMVWVAPGLAARLPEALAGAADGMQDGHRDGRVELDEAFLHVDARELASSRRLDPELGALHVGGGDATSPPVDVGDVDQALLVERALAEARPPLALDLAAAETARQAAWDWVRVAEALRTGDDPVGLLEGFVASHGDRELSQVARAGELLERLQAPGRGAVDTEPPPAGTVVEQAAGRLLYEASITYELALRRYDDGDLRGVARTLSSYVQRYAHATVSIGGETVAVDVPHVVAARRWVEAWDALGAESEVVAGAARLGALRAERDVAVLGRRRTLEDALVAREALAQADLRALDEVLIGLGAEERVFRLGAFLQDHGLASVDDAGERVDLQLEAVHVARSLLAVEEAPEDGLGLADAAVDDWRSVLMVAAGGDDAALRQALSGFVAVYEGRPGAEDLAELDLARSKLDELGGAVALAPETGGQAPVVARPVFEPPSEAARARRATWAVLERLDWLSEDELAGDLSAVVARYGDLPSPPVELDMASAWVAWHALQER